MLITRNYAQGICGVGLTQLFFATASVVCGFVVLGLFQQVNGIGLWLGLPVIKIAIILLFSSRSCVN